MSKYDITMKIINFLFLLTITFLVSACSDARSGPQEQVDPQEQKGAALPDLFVAEMKVETINLTARGGDEEPTLFVYAKIKNDGTDMSDDFFTQYKWSYVRDKSRTYDDIIGMTPITVGEYYGGVENPAISKDEWEDGYPWTLVKFSSNLQKGDTVTVVLDYDDRIKESNEENNVFVFELE